MMQLDMIKKKADKVELRDSIGRDELDEMLRATPTHVRHCVQ
jgi:hypothetical protein